MIADGTEIAFDATRHRDRVGAATACPARSDWPHVVELRTLDDALDLRARLRDGNARVVVIGAGFIGLEVAATARGLGNSVVVLEGAPAPLIRGLGAEMGAACAAVHADHDVAIRCGITVAFDRRRRGAARRRRAGAGRRDRRRHRGRPGHRLARRQRARDPRRNRVRLDAQRGRAWRVRGGRRGALAEPTVRRGDAGRALDERRRTGRDGRVEPAGRSAR